MIKFIKNVDHAKRIVMDALITINARNVKKIFLFSLVTIYFMMVLVVSVQMEHYPHKMIINVKGAQISVLLVHLILKHVMVVRIRVYFYLKRRQLVDNVIWIDGIKMVNIVEDVIKVVKHVQIVKKNLV